MAQQGLNTIILDTSELIKGLEALAHPRSKWSLRDGTNMYSALRLSYHLMTRDVVYFDGKVRAANADRIEAAFEAIRNNMSSEIATALEMRINGKSFSKPEEKEFTKSAIKDAANYFQDCSKDIQKKFFEFQFGSGLTEIDTYLIDPIKNGYSSQQLLDFIFDHKKITGRRFYVSIYENEELLDRIKNWVRKGEVTPGDFNLMFTLFRAKLSETKSLHLFGSDEISECFYEPDRFRGDLLRSLIAQNEERVNYTQVLEDGMYRVWLSKNNFIMKNEDVEIPSILNLPLHEENKANFLQAVLGFSQSDFKSQYDQAIELISKTKIHNINDTLRNLEISLRSAHGRSKVLNDSGNWVFLSEGQDLAKFLLSTTKELGEDIATEGSVTGLIGAITRIAVKLRGKGIRAGTKIHSSFGNSIVGMSRDDRKMKLDQIFH